MFGWKSVYCLLLRVVREAVVAVMYRTARLLAQLYHSRMAFIFVVLLLLPVVGTASYVLIEGWSWFDALYMSIITLTTVGFMEVQPLSVAGRVFTILYLFFGVGTAFYSLTILAEKVLLSEAMVKRIINAQLRSMNNHYIVCGYGRTGRRIVEELRQLGKSYAVIDIDAGRLQILQQEGIPAVVGDAAEEAVLLRAGVRTARGLVTALDSDASNVFVVLSARELNEHLHIVARAETASAEPKLKRAGANAILSPYEIGAVRLTNMLLQRSLIDSFDIVTEKLAVDISIEEFSIGADRTASGNTLQDLELDKRFGALVFALKYPDGRIEFPPAQHTVLPAGAVLIVAAPGERMQQIYDFFNNGASPGGRYDR